MLDSIFFVCAPAVWLWGVGANRADFLEGFVLSFAGRLFQVILHSLSIDI